MNCSTCYQSFNLSDRVPVLICCEGHSCCSRCSQKLKQCPLCRLECLKERKVNFALKDLIKASRDGDLCPQIPSDQIVLGDKIAEGGFALIYAAEWFDIPVAIKMVSLTEKGKKELQREMSLLFSLNHPSILRVFGLTFFDDSVAIVMEKASSHIPSPTLLSSTTLRYAKELLPGSEVSPLKVCCSWRLKTSKYPLSRRNLADTTLVTRATAMSPKYAAPEQFDSRPGPFSDIYSLGLVLYELLTGRIAYDGFSMMQILGAKVHGKPLPFDDSTPKCLQELIMKCINPEASYRPILNFMIESLCDLQLQLSLVNYPLFSFEGADYLLSVSANSLKRNFSRQQFLNQQNLILVEKVRTLSNVRNEFLDKRKCVQQKISMFETNNQSLKDEIELLKEEIL
ncbi:hypothetical protein GEMRC1_010180 [Eukaryota sp. GEM-RC1]